MASVVGAIVRTELILRWRRTATLVTLLVMILFAYSVVPDFHGGSTVMSIEGHRAVYNSASISIATAIFASFFLGLFGFYLVSTSVRRDLVSGTGFVIASTPIRSAEYLLGKLAGNIVFLASLLTVYLAGILVMHLLRGEAPIEPLTYLVTYALLDGPALVFVAMMGLLFECIPPLSGRGGDILYFILWIVILALGAGNAETGTFNWTRDALDLMGLGYLLGELHRQGVPSSMAVGHTTFDQTLAPVTIQALAPTASVVVARLIALVVPAPLFFVALAAFHRFDPARVRSAARSGGRGLMSQVQRLIKPVTRILVPLVSWSGRIRSRFVGQVIADAATTLMLSPAATVALLVLNVAGAIYSLDRVRGAVLPATFVCLILALADLPTRDKSAGTTPMLDGMPGLKGQRVLWKVATAVLLSVAFVAVALVRIAIIDPAAGVTLLVGAVFTGALAVSLGVLSGTPKTFAAFFLFFIYLVLNGGQLPALDFAGWNRVATPLVVLGYFVLTLVLVAIAAAWHRSRSE